MVRTEGDLLLFFDCLMHDYIHAELGQDIEQFRTVVFKHFLLRLQPDQDHDESVMEEKDTPQMKVFEAVCNKLYLLIQTNKS